MRVRAPMVLKLRGSTATSRGRRGLVGAEHVVRAQSLGQFLQAFAQPLGFGCTERRDDLLLARLQDMLDAGHELPSLGSEVHQLGAPVGGIRAALQETEMFALAEKL